MITGGYPSLTSIELSRRRPARPLPSRKGCDAFERVVQLSQCLWQRLAELPIADPVTRCALRLSPTARSELGPAAIRWSHPSRKWMDIVLSETPRALGAHARLDRSTSQTGVMAVLCTRRTSVVSAIGRHASRPARALARRPTVRRRRNRGPRCIPSESCSNSSPLVKEGLNFTESECFLLTPAGMMGFLMPYVDPDRARLPEGWAGLLRRSLSSSSAPSSLLSTTSRLGRPRPTAPPAPSTRYSC